MAFKFNIFTKKLDYYETGSGTPFSKLHADLTDLATSVHPNDHAPLSDNQDLSGKIDHSLSTAENDVLVGGTGGTLNTFVKKTIAEFKTILGLGSAAYTASTDYLGATATAAKATILATARAINGVDFDGSAAITVPSLSSPFNYKLVGATIDHWYTQPGDQVWIGIAYGANRLRAIPFLYTGTVDGIAINVTAGGAGHARLGIYENGATLYPGSLVLDAGEVDCSTTGDKKITGLTQVLTPGKLYWLVYNAEVEVGCRTMDNNSSVPILGFASNLLDHLSAMDVAYTYGAMPASFPAGAGFYNYAPAIFIRFSA